MSNTTTKWYLNVSGDAFDVCPLKSPFRDRIMAHYGCLDDNDPQSDYHASLEIQDMNDLCVILDHYKGHGVMLNLVSEITQPELIASASIGSEGDPRGYVRYLQPTRLSREAAADMLESIANGLIRRAPDARATTTP